VVAVHIPSAIAASLFPALPLAPPVQVFQYAVGGFVKDGYAKTVNVHRPDNQPRNMPPHVLSFSHWKSTSYIQGVDLRA